MADGSRSVWMLGNVLVVGLFILALVLPGVLTWSELGRGGAEWENRTLAEAPGRPNSLQSLAAFPQKAEDFVNDHFGFRPRLIQARNQLLVRGLGVSPSKDVLLGKDGWLFYGTPDVTKNYVSAQPFTEMELQRWADVLTERHSLLQAFGTHYLLVLVPEKQSIYAEYMPDYVRHAPDFSRVDQLIAYLREHTPVTIVDLRSILRQHKDKHILYLKNDTHWNWFGAYLGYYATMKAAMHWNSVTLAPRGLGEYKLADSFRKGGDLVKLLGLPEEAEEHFLVPVLKVGYQAKKSVAPQEYQPYYKIGNPTAIYTKDNQELPTLVMFYDSYGFYMIRDVAEHFRRSVFLHQWDFMRQWMDHTFSIEIFEKERPDYFIEEIVERKIATPPSNMQRFELRISSPESEGNHLILDPYHPVINGYCVGPEPMTITALYHGKPHTATTKEAPELGEDFPQFPEHVTFLLALPQEDLTEVSDLTLLVNDESRYSFSVNFSR